MVAAQGVVAPETCGVGGDLFALVHRDGDAKPKALNASGRMGSKANPETLRGHGSIPRDHPFTASIPGCVDGLCELSARMGRMDIGSALEPAIALAREGFPASNEQARAFAGQSEHYSSNPAVADFYIDGQSVEPDQVVKRPLLAATLGDVARDGREGFYQGRAGADILETLGSHVVAEDLASSQADWIDPIAVDIGDQRAWTFPPNSAGYLGTATLAVFTRLDPPGDPSHPVWWHLLIEAHRSLAWEREDAVSDPDSAPYEPDALLAQDRLDMAAASVDRDRAGTWPTRPAKASGTAYMCVTDSEGLSVSVIQSNYRGTGSFLGAPNSGFLFHDRAAGFNLIPGHPNELGAGKRPAHTLSPTIWTRGNMTTYVLGTRGGEIQPQLVAQLGARAVVGGDPLETAQEAPRWSMTEYGPGSRSAVSLEPGSGVADALESMGHSVIEKPERQPGWGPMAIIRRGESGRLEAAADPRVDTTAALVF